jgi:hypothetical protein
VTGNASRARAPARESNPIHSGSVSSSTTGSSARATDDDDRSRADDDDDDRPGGFITPARAQAAIATAQVRESTGMAITAEAAAAIRDDVLGGREVRDPAGYLRSAITAEAARDPALLRWLDRPTARPAGRAERAPASRAARDVLDAARHPEGLDPGRGPRAAEDVHRGADMARQALAGRPTAPPPAEDTRPPVAPPSLDPATLAAAQRAEPDPPDPPPEEPPPEEPGDPPEPPDDDVPF